MSAARDPYDPDDMIGLRELASVLAYALDARRVLADFEFAALNPAVGEILSQACPTWCNPGADGGLDEGLAYLAQELRGRVFVLARDLDRAAGGAA